MNYIELLSNGVKRLRERKGLTQEQFAERIGLSVQGYRFIETGKSQPLPKTIDTICEVFGINIVELLLPNATNEIEQLQKNIINKIKTYSLEKLQKIDNIIDLL